MRYTLALLFVCLFDEYASERFWSDAPMTLAPQERATSIQQPSRDNQNVQNGTGRIRGRVVRGDTGEPLRWALVRLSTPEAREPRSVMTDAAGRYEISELLAGRYNVTATKDGYVQLSYGQLRPFQSGKPLQLTAGQLLERIDLSLPRAGVIAGRVTDENGDPIANLNVQALQLRYLNGRKIPMNVGMVSTTWDNGEYRLWGLSPGDYLVSASPSGMAGAAVARTDRIGYAPSYYPNTANPSEAQRVAVAVGQVVSNITIGLVATRTANITGVALDTEGRAANGGQVTLAPRDPAGILMRNMGLIRQDGTFTISNVPPGDYVLRAALAPSSPTGQPQLADAAITVNGEDVNNVRLVPK